jgi:hypothetical protein
MQLEIHTLICKKDLLFAINSFKSLQKFEEFENIPIFLHEDGSMDETDFSFLKNNVKNISIIKRKEADLEIEKHIKNYRYCSQYRLGDSHINLWHKIKLFDYYYFSKSKRILGLDSDLLFMKKPDNIIEFIKRNIPFYFPDVNNAYCFNEPKDIMTLNKVNTGLIYIPSENYYEIEPIEHALSNLVKNDINYFPSWIEQSAFAHMFYAKNYKSLDENKYRIPFFQNIDIKKVECLHFVSYPKTRELYKKYFDYLNFKEESSIYTKQFIIKFNNNAIPLEINIKKQNKFLIFQFYWGLDKTKQNQLDHIFKINNEEYKFQSELNNFFIINLTNDIKIEHTYDWFGEQNWENLDSIKI